MAKNENNNYLDFIPFTNPANTWDAADGKVTIHRVNTGFFPKIAQTFFKRPRITHIDLDEYGSFLWQKIDGKATVGELAQEMKQQFGEAAEPLYDRLVQYMRILHNNQFIQYKKTDR